MSVAPATETIVDVLATPQGIVPATATRMDALRAKVAAREKAAALTDAMEGGAEGRQQRRLATQLPSFCDALHSYVVQQRRARSKTKAVSSVARPQLIEELCKRLPHPKLPKSAVEKLLDMCLAVAPQWCRQVGTAAVKTSGVDNSLDDNHGDGKSDAVSNNKAAGATGKGDTKGRLVQFMQFDGAVNYAAVRALAKAHASKTAVVATRETEGEK